MPGAVCLQGGAEFGPACRDMDVEALGRASGGPVVVAPFASAPGPEAARAGRHGQSYYRSLGADDVRVLAPPGDAAAVAEAAKAVRGAALVVLPGGSPARLLAAFTAAAHEPLRAALVAVLAAGGVLSGASAGAMVLAARTVLPDRPGDGGPPVVAALGIVPRTLVVPHLAPGTALDDEGGLLGRLTAAVRGTTMAETTVVGLPECGGLVVDDPGGGTGRARAVGAAACVVRRPGADPQVVAPGAEVQL